MLKMQISRDTDTVSTMSFWYLTYLSVISAYSGILVELIYSYWTLQFMYWKSITRKLIYFMLQIICSIDNENTLFLIFL